jgi:hypothetical protein
MCIHCRHIIESTQAHPGLHLGYKIIRSPDAGRRPESGEGLAHPITHTFSHNHRPPRITSGLQQHPVARMAAAGRNPGMAIHIHSRMRFHTTTASPGLHPGYNITRSPDAPRRKSPWGEGRRPESGKGHSHPITQTFSHNHRRPRISLRSIRATKTGFKITCGHPENRGLNSPHGPIPAKFRGWRNLLFYGGA